MGSEVLAFSSAINLPLKYVFAVYVSHTGNMQLHRVEEIHPSCRPWVDLTTRENRACLNSVTR